MRLLVTGKTGQVVTALMERGIPQGFDMVAIGRPEFDLAGPRSGLAAIETARPDVIVSAAAYTAVDKAESDEQAAQAINAFGPGAVAGIAAQLGVPIIHLSTDYVFDGQKSTPYVESDQTNPIGVYGRTKLAGEQAVATATSDHVILRTAWVYSPFGSNFLKTMLRLGAERPELRVVGDQIGNPTSALDIADAVLTVACNLSNRANDQELRGIFHMTGTGEATWAEFAEEILRASARLGGPTASIARIRTCDYPTPAKRPANSRLLCEKLDRLHGIKLPDWQSSTHATLVRLLGPKI